MAAGRIEGIILAAGKGTRMLPLTNLTPKPLLPVAGVPVLEAAAGKLLGSGAERLHVNLFHMAAAIREYAEGRDWPVTFHEEERLLDTGGGIGNMAAGLREAEHVLLHNGDIVSSFDFTGALEFHSERGAVVTLILMPSDGSVRTPPASVTIDGEGSVVDIGRAAPAGGPAADGKERNGRAILGYTGMAVISGEALDSFPRGRKGLVPVLLEMITNRPGSVMGFDASAGGPPHGAAWGEIGSPASYLDLHGRILLEGTGFAGIDPVGPIPLRAGEGASIDPRARWAGFLDVGRKAVIEADTFLENCVVLEGAVVRRGTRLKSAILYDDRALEVKQ